MLALDEAGNQLARLVEVLRLVGRVAVVRVLTVLPLVGEFDVQVGAAVEPNNGAAITGHRYFHAQAHEAKGLAPGTHQLFNKAFSLAVIAFAMV